MKTKNTNPAKRIAKLVCLAATFLVGCSIYEEPAQSSAIRSVNSGPTENDATACELITRKIVSSSDRDEVVLQSFYTPEFSRLIRQGCQSADGVPYLNYDFIMETQDSNPTPLRLGPARIQGNKILVSFVQQHQGAKPFTKTWVFVNRNGKWLVEDLLTSGLDRQSPQQEDSMYADIIKNL